MSIPKWTEDRTNELLNIVAGVDEVGQDLIAKAAETLDTTTRSVSSKLRKLGRKVVSLAEAKTSKFTETETAQLVDFVQNNPNTYTYAEIAEAFANGRFSAREVQGKILSLEMHGLVNRAPVKEVVRKYSEAEEAVFVKMAKSGAFLEDIAAELNRDLNSVRGKALSLSRSIEGFSIPAQRESYAKAAVDAFANVDVANSTVEEIAAATNKTVRGVKTILTRRGLVAKDYDGAKKAAKNAAANAEA